MDAERASFDFLPALSGGNSFSQAAHLCTSRFRWVPASLPSAGEPVFLRLHRCLTSSASPVARMFLVAFTSRSCSVPQTEHFHRRTERFFLDPRSPQVEHLWDVGSQQETTRNALPYSSALYSRSILNVRQPASAIALESLRFFTIPDTFRSSMQTTWFLRINRVPSLCRKSRRLSETMAWALATCRRALAKRFEPCCLCFRFLWSLLSRFSAERRNLGGRPSHRHW